MLQNGLGDLLKREVSAAGRFVDLFTGSAAVAGHVARHFNIPVLAFDLQEYSVALAKAVVGRHKSLDWKRVWRNWHRRASTVVSKTPVPNTNKLTQATVAEARKWAEGRRGLPITKAYGGHYFSPSQAVWIDALRKTLPRRTVYRSIALAALVQAASQCAAAPGHTAQPFQPTRTAKRFLQEAWERNLVERTRLAFSAIASSSAKRTGSAEVLDANAAAKKLKKNDLVFIDPPYSGVHYSRFYHVLETITQGTCGAVTGIGRYPEAKRRPRSKYSMRTTSRDALDDLLKTVSSQGAKAILTFPDHLCSNGLSGNSVLRIAEKHFQVKQKTVKSKFSTLGGTSDDERVREAARDARLYASEMMLLLEPRGL